MNKLENKNNVNNVTPTEKKNETKTYILLIYFITMF
jgi:nitrate reductase NapE component